MKKINYRITGTTSRSLLGACLVSVFMFFSCARENTDPRTGGNGGEGNNLSLDTRAVPIAVANNARVYMFTGGTSNTLGNYNHQILNINRTVNDLRMIARAGTWDIALLSAETATDLNNVIAPTVGTAGGAQKMFELAPVGGNLPSAPDLLTTYIDEQVIIADMDNTASTSFAHNMAKVQLTIVDAKGLVTTANAHTISLGNVPTTLAWDGKLLPSKTNPTVSTTKMTGRVTVSDVAGGVQESSMLTFLVPAHRGTDFLATNPIDTTTSKLTVSVNLPLSGGGNYLKNDVVIPKVPRSGQILNVRILIQGELTIESNILDWTEIRTDAGLSNTTLQVSKTNVGLSSLDSLIVKTNASSYSVAQDPAGTWFTATQSGERIVINATTSSYTAPRSSWIDITANNVTKRIAINQRPDVGTITAPTSFWVSPTTGNTTRTITVNSTGPWTLTAPNPATVTTSTTGGNAGTTNITFTRKVHSGVISDYTPYYGNSVFTLRNTQTLETITVTAQNLFLVSDDVDVPNATGTNVKENVDKVTCMGGTGGFSIISPPTWITSALINPTTHSITLTAQGEPTGERREGTMTLRHNDDPNYTVTIKVIQDFLITIPPFDFFVIKYTWPVGSTTTDSDADIKVQFEGNGMSYDGTTNFSNSKWVGFNVTTQMYGSQTLLRWGSDARGGEGETVFFNAPVIDGDSNSPRFVKLVCYAYWYTSTSTANRNNPIRTTIFAYEGGAMRQVGTNFVNDGGTMLYTNSRQQRVTATGSSSITNPTKLVEIIYDRIKHSAQITYTGTELNTPLLPTPTGMELDTPFIPISRAVPTDEDIKEIAKKQAEWEVSNKKD